MAGRKGAAGGRRWEGIVNVAFENRRSGRDRRKGERRRFPGESARLANGIDRRDGIDRRQYGRRMADRSDPIPERYDYLWRNRWP